MPRTGGVYNLPSGNPIEAGTIASSNSMNDTLSDLGDEITGSIPRDGSAGPTSNLTMANLRHTNVANATARNNYAAAGQVQDSSFCKTSNVSGTANAVTADLTPALSAYVDGLQIFIVPALNNAGAVTLSINTLPTKAVLSSKGEPLSAANLVAGRPVLLAYYNGNFYIVGGSGGGGTDALFNSVHDSAGFAWLPSFSAGYVAYHGAGDTLAFNTNFIFGTDIPNPSGINAPCLLIGAGVPRACIITDQAVAGTDGTDLIIAAGETAGTGTDNGGDLLCFGGGALAGRGGDAIWQGGTSANAQCGDTIVRGGNSTNGGGTRGNVFIQGGENGVGGGDVDLIATYNPGSPAVDPGEIHFRANSDLLLTVSKDGAFFFKNLGAGLAGQPLVSGGVADCPRFLSTGFTGTVTLAKITPGGTNGSLTFASGILTGHVDPT
jgi:hypothetical protein